MTDSTSVRVDPANAAQEQAWDGAEGEFWASHADHFDRGVAVHHRRLLDAAGIEADHHVLDLGCGSGQSTRDAARRATSGGALGVDLSAPMLGVARARATAEGLRNVRFEHADAQVRAFEPGSFDVVISRFGAMFFGDPVVAFANVGRAMRRGAQLVLVVWQPLERNEWLTEISSTLAAGRERPTPPPGVPGPFGFADPERTAQVLGDAGFVDVVSDGFSAPMSFGKDVDDAAEFVLGVSGWMLEGLDDDGRRSAIEALRAGMSRHLVAEGVAYGSAAWLVTARRA